MMYFCVTSAFLVLSATAVNGRTQYTRDESDEVCNKLFHLGLEYFEELKSVNPDRFNSLENMGQMMLNVNISKSGELRSFICKLTALKKLTDVKLLGINERVMQYEQVVLKYKYMQNILGSIGGYTNIPRIVEMILDIQSWLKVIPASASTPKEGYSLEKLTRFFQVMQVKYGSRWLSYVAMVKNQVVLIEDPVKTAEDLYETESKHEVMEVLRPLGLDDMEGARIISYEFLLNRSSFANRNLHVFETAGEALYGLGELGLFTLE